tara:strand:- start:295 stop:405 length:111 start_codon:yes stop_codon:yes gene_type:complete
MLDVKIILIWLFLFLEINKVEEDLETIKGALGPSQS